MLQDKPCCTGKAHPESCHLQHHSSSPELRNRALLRSIPLCVRWSRSVLCVCLGCCWCLGSEPSGGAEGQSRQADPKSLPAARWARGWSWEVFKRYCRARSLGLLMFVSGSTKPCRAEAFTQTTQCPSQPVPPRATRCVDGEKIQFRKKFWLSFSPLPLLIFWHKRVWCSAQM